MRSASLAVGRSSLNARRDCRHPWRQARLRHVGRLFFATVATFFLLLTHSVTAEPLRAADVPDFYQRVITLPGAVLAPQRGEQSGQKTRVFDIFYVFERTLVDGREWLSVGKRADGPVAGWIQADHTQNWSMMLTMQYTPPGGRRSRVLFFENREDLAVVIMEHETGPVVAQLTAAADGGKRNGPAVVAIEPRAEAGTVVYSNRPYLIRSAIFKGRRSPRGTHDAPADRQPEC